MVQHAPESVEETPDFGGTVTSPPTTTNHPAETSYFLGPAWTDWQEVLESSWSEILLVQQQYGARQDASRIFVESARVALIVFGIVWLVLLGLLHGGILLLFAILSLLGALVLNLIQVGAPSTAPPFFTLPGLSSRVCTPVF